MLYDPKWEQQNEAKPIEPWRQLLLDGAAIMETRGHCKGDTETADGRVCVIGALMRADWPSGAYSKAMDRFRDFLGQSPIKFNNYPTRPGEEVIKAMRDCAASRS